MNELFRALYTQGPISGGLYVSPISALAPDGYSCLITAGTDGHVIGTVENFTGNTDSQFDAGTNSAISVTVRLFGPTRNVAVTGLTTGISAGTLVYLTAAYPGFVTLSGTITAGVTLQAATVNGSYIELAETLY